MSGVETLQQELATERGSTVSQLLDPLFKKANFFKHADNDADATVEIAEDDAVIMLRLACQDFRRITGGMPREAQVFDLWVYAVAFPKSSVAPPHKQDLVRASHARFPGIGEAAIRGEKKKIALAALERALADPALQMEFKREVILPAKPPSPAKP